MLRISLPVALLIAVAAGYTPRADAFIFGELKELGRAVVGTVKGVGQDAKRTGRAVRQAFTPERSPTEQYRHEYDRRMGKQYREQRRQARYAEELAQKYEVVVAEPGSGGQAYESKEQRKAARAYEEHTQKAERRMRQASRRYGEASKSENRQLSKQFGASEKRLSERIRDEHRWFEEKRDAKRDDRRARFDEFRSQRLGRP